MKYSKQREMILNCIKESHQHLTADAIYDTLKKDHPNLSLGTVYRNLAQLADHGMILKISIPGQPDCFDKNIDDHFHFLCIDCGNVKDVFVDELSEIKSHVEQQANVDIESIDITFKGVCTTCKQKKVQ